jgi:hypothetical protein
MQCILELSRRNSKFGSLLKRNGDVIHVCLCNNIAAIQEHFIGISLLIKDIPGRICA